MQNGGNKVGAHVIRNTFAMKVFATTSIIQYKIDFCVAKNTTIILAH
jgi:hypothetical protein